MTITVRQYGLVQRTGTLASIVDGDAGTGWAPVNDQLQGYPDGFFSAVDVLNFGKPFPCIEFDYGEPVRLSAFLLQVEQIQTVGDGVLIASNNPAHSVADTLQVGDLLLGSYTRAQLVAGRVLQTLAATQNIQGRYIRLLQRDTLHPAPLLDGGGGTPDGGGGVNGGTFAYFDGVSGDFIMPNYSSTLTIEGWGSGASGGTTGMANAGGDTTVSTYSLTAHGGAKSTATTPNGTPTPAAGGTATGGNQANVTGGAGGVPVNGVSGKGGDAPFGGSGGDAVSAPVPWTSFSGHDGAAPGAGGSGFCVLLNHIAGADQATAFPGGAAGGYFKHVLTKDVDGPDPGDHIAYACGLGGAPTNGNGAGAPGRVRFSWT